MSQERGEEAGDGLETEPTKLHPREADPAPWKPPRDRRVYSTPFHQAWEEGQCPDPASVLCLTYDRESRPSSKVLCPVVPQHHGHVQNPRTGGATPSRS